MSICIFLDIKQSMQHKQSMLILTLLLTLLTVNPTQAQEPTDLIMEGIPAFEGHFKSGEWLPIWVELENNGPDIDGEIHVRKTLGQGVATYAVPVALPTGSRKRVPVYVLPSSYSRQLELELIDKFVDRSIEGDDARLLSQKFSVEPLPNETYFAGLIASEQGALSLITSASMAKDARDITLVDVSLIDLPEQAQALNSFDLLILNNVDTSALTAGQSRALTEWVLLGGHLIIGGGVNAQRTVAGLSPSLLPVALEEAVKVDQVSELDAFVDAVAISMPGPFVLATGEVIDGETLVRSDGLPLLVQKQVGKGRVEYVALDLAIAPFSGWIGTPQLWSKLLEQGMASYPEWTSPDISSRTMRAERLLHPLANLPSLDLPSIHTLGWLLGLYILVVGPANYLLLRWWHRLQWAWLTIPLLTIIFSMGAFGVGYAMRGTDVILSHIAIVEPLPEGTSARLSSYMGLFSPLQESYEVTIESGGLISSMRSEQNPWGTNGPIASEMLFLQGSPLQLRGLSVNQWSMQSFMVEDRWDEFGQIQGDFQLGKGRMKGILVNGTDQPFYDVTLVLGQYFKRIGDLPAGQRIETTIDLDEKIVSNWGPSLGWQIYPPDTNRIELSDPARRGDELKRQIMEALSDPSLGQTGILSQDGDTISQAIRFIGWMGDVPPAVLVSGDIPARQTTAIVYQTFDLSLPDKGAFTLPGGLLPPTLIESSANGGPCGSNNSIYIAQGEAVFEFYLPPIVSPERVETIRLSLSDDGGPEVNIPDVAFQNWETDSWSKLQNSIAGINVLSGDELRGLISDSGKIRVQLSKQQDMFGCTSIGLGMTIE